MATDRVVTKNSLIKSQGSAAERGERERLISKGAKITVV